MPPTSIAALLILVAAALGSREASRGHLRDGYIIAVLASQPWYESSLAFNIMSLALATVTIIATIWGAFYAARPRQALLYRLRSSRAVSRLDDSDVRSMSQSLKHPKVIELYLRGRGRRDVSSAAFDEGSPILFEVGGPIVKLLAQPVSFPPERSVPKSVVDKGILAIGPSLIGRDQALTLLLLADVANPRLTVRSSLIDVSLQPRLDFINSGRKLALITIAQAAAISLIMLAGRIRPTGIYILVDDVLAFAFSILTLTLLGTFILLMAVCTSSSFKRIRNYFR